MTTMIGSNRWALVFAAALLLVGATSLLLLLLVDDDSATTVDRQVADNRQPLWQDDGAAFVPWFFRSRQHSSNNNDDVQALLRADCDGLLTIASQGTLDRLDRLVNHTQHWRWPISFVLYVPASQLAEAEAALARLSSSTPAMRQRVDVHVLIAARDGEPYPINRLRNLAWQYVTSPLVLLLDADFLVSGPLVCPDLQALFSPDKHLHVIENDAKTESNDFASILSSGRYALVLPAFHLNDAGVFSHAKQQVGPPVDSDGVGQRQTDYARWAGATTAYRVRHAFGYEPYVIVPTHGTPRYEESFVGYGNDKLSHFFELEAAGYALIVLPHAHVVHMPHANNWPGANSAQRANSQLQRFLWNLQLRYPESSAWFFRRYHIR